MSGLSGVSSKSLGKGSAPPGPVPEGLIRVYSMRFCPYAKRTLLVLNAKGIKHEVVNINLKNKPEWFFQKHPLGQVPVLETSKGQLIYESSITCEYLDEAYPEKKLFPDDPYEKAYQKMIFNQFSKILSRRKTQYFSGDSITMIDYLLWTWFERLELFKIADCVDHTPNLKLWIAAMTENPFVKAIFTDLKTSQGFMELYLNNSPEACDYGL
uniref:Glutathione S-transferase omega n=1 Tax=Ornithorhynchus anatinus TaxID=9258 RepID=A0A6I8NFU1_ORNAN